MRKLLLHIFVFTCCCLSAQRIQDYRLAAIGGSVDLRFSISPGSQCGGYSILFSNDSLNYYTIYNYPGICGDLAVKQDYSYLHSSPTYDQYNYYKVELFALETSPAKKVYVSAQSSSAMLVYPNPLYYIYDLLYFKIFNASNIRLDGYLYNQYGKPLRYIQLSTLGDTGAINVNDLDNGLYVLWLTDGLSAYSSKFVIAR